MKTTTFCNELVIKIGCNVGEGLLMEILSHSLPQLICFCGRSAVLDGSNILQDSLSVVIFGNIVHSLVQPMEPGLKNLEVANPNGRNTAPGGFSNALDL